MPPRGSRANTLRMKATIDLAFLFIGGVHQVLHLAPVAVQVSRLRPDLAVHCICGDDATAAAVQEVNDHLHGRVQVTRLPQPWISRVMARITGRKAATKGPLLASIRFRARRAQAIIVPERTSAVLRAMGWTRPLVHFRHGAGDRAPPSEVRLGAFDLIVVPGEKDVDRAVRQGVDRARLRACGYVKLDYLRDRMATSSPAFANGRPTVLYNPHFDAATSSIGLAGEVIECFCQQERYNLIFAPHVRAVEDLSATRRRELEALAVPGRIIVDLGSPDLFNMRHALSADIYLGDMSSQLYEFLVRPRPAAFINAHHVAWQQDPRYAGWHLGEVADDVTGVMQALDRAVGGHDSRRALQEQAVAFAFGHYRGAIVRAADVLLDFLLVQGNTRAHPVSGAD